MNIGDRDDSAIQFLLDGINVSKCVRTGWRKKRNYMGKVRLVSLLFKFLFYSFAGPSEIFA
jgi:hypothetical protein